MSNENNSEKEKENFFSMLKDGFSKFQKNLEEQSRKNVENWEQAKGKVGNFFKKMANNWNKQVQEWGDDIEKIQEQNKADWEAKKQQIRADMEQWQENARQDWKDGVKAWNRGVYKGIFMFLIILIILLGGLFVIVYLFTTVLSYVP